MKEIILRNGGIAFIDDIDFERISRYGWTRMKGKKTFYAARKESGRLVSMHREILCYQKGIGHCDHIDGNGLNNTRNNLRICTPQQNTFNRGANRNNGSGFKGVRARPNGKTWQSRIMIDGKCVNLGDFPSAETAARAYDEAARRFHGEFARTNF